MTISIAMSGNLTRAALHTVAAGLTVGMVWSGVGTPVAAEAAPSIRTVSQSSLPYQLAGVIADSSSTLGVADSQLYTLSEADVDKTLDQLQSLGVKDIRIGVPWLYIQPTAAGAYDWSKLDYIVDAADERGMNILGVINGTPSWAGTPIISGQPDTAAFSTFATAVADRYKGHISAYEIWNEPNGVIGMAPVSATAYTALLRTGYTAIKNVDPDITVVGGVLGSTSNIAGVSVDPVTFVNQMYAAGAQGYFDALSYHPYNYTLPFSLGADVTNSPLQQLTGIRALMEANGDSDVKVWVSEYGLPTNLVSQAQQAAYIKDFVSAWQGVDGAGPIFIYSTRDIDTGNWNSEGNFGIFETNWTAKPAADAMAEMIRQLGDGTFVPVTIPASEYEDASYYLGALILTTELFSVGSILPTAASQLVGGLVAAVGTLTQQAVQGAGQLGYHVASLLKPVVPAPIFDAAEAVGKEAGRLGVQLQHALHTVAVNAYAAAQDVTNAAVRLTIEATARVLATVAQTVTGFNTAAAHLNPTAATPQVESHEDGAQAHQQSEPAGLADIRTADNQVGTADKRSAHERVHAVRGRLAPRSPHVRPKATWRGKHLHGATASRSTADSADKPASNQAQPGRGDRGKHRAGKVHRHAEPGRHDRRTGASQS